MRHSQNCEYVEESLLPTVQCANSSCGLHAQKVLRIAIDFDVLNQLLTRNLCNTVKEQLPLKLCMAYIITVRSWCESRTRLRNSCVRHVVLQAVTDWLLGSGNHANYIRPIPDFLKVVRGMDRWNGGQTDSAHTHTRTRTHTHWSSSSPSWFPTLTVFPYDTKVVKRNEMTRQEEMQWQDGISFV
jgi:hypothetical protein